ncbi:MAG: hypothetical protein R3264_05720 [Anaerolineae bacterium]|nr:hypothetical protein [Anaerolineae bacterium]
MVTLSEIEAWLQEGIGAAKAGQYEKARFRLLDVVEQDQANEAAWFWLYRVFDRSEDKRVCLENLLTINPNNEWAKQELSQYLSPKEAAQLERLQRLALGIDSVSVTRRLVAAFWAGISIIFLGGGIIASSEWLVTGVRSNAFVSYITVTQFFELVVAVTFVIVGLIGLNVAIGVFWRSMIGFYGSILLALLLLLIGPIMSLITSPPNFLTLVCTGGVSGIIVLLTLASQPAFKNN